MLQQLPADQWISCETVLSSDLCEESKSWLCHLDSMTQMIKHQAQSSFELIVLSESVSDTTLAEQEFLGLSETKAYVREIIMKADHNDWLYARSVFPATVVDDDDQTLMRLGNKPLGSLFFAEVKDRQDEDSPRKTIDAGLLTADHELRRVESFPVQSDDQLFARRSLFHYLGKPALVQEVFLPQHPIYR